MGTGALSSGIKLPGREDDHSHATGAEVHAFMAWCLKQEGCLVIRMQDKTVAHEARQRISENVQIFGMDSNKSKFLSQEEIKGTLNPGSACYHWAQKLPSSRLLSINVKN
jgi:hypothetical protein